MCPRCGLHFETLPHTQATTDPPDDAGAANTVDVAAVPVAAATLTDDQDTGDLTPEAVDHAALDSALFADYDRDEEATLSGSFITVGGPGDAGYAEDYADDAGVDTPADALVEDVNNEAGEEIGEDTGEDAGEDTGEEVGEDVGGSSLVFAPVDMAPFEGTTFLDEAGADGADDSADTADTADAGDTYDVVSPDVVEDADTGALAGRSTHAGEDPLFAPLDYSAFDATQSDYADAGYEPEVAFEQSAPDDAALDVPPRPAPDAVLDVASDIARDAEDEPSIVGAPVAMSIPTTTVATVDVQDRDRDRHRDRNRVLLIAAAILAVVVLSMAAAMIGRGDIRDGNVTPTAQAEISPTLPVVAIVTGTRTDPTTLATQPVLPTTTSIVEPATLEPAATTEGTTIATTEVLPTDTVLVADTALPADTSTPEPVATANPNTNTPEPVATVVANTNTPGPAPTDTVAPIPTTTQPAPADTPVPQPTNTRAPLATSTSVPPRNTPVGPLPTNTRAPVATSTSVPPRNTPVGPLPTNTRQAPSLPTQQPARAIGDLVTGVNNWTLLPMWVQQRTELQSPDPKVYYKPAGVYWLVRIDGRNTSNQTRSFGGTMDFVLRDANGRLYAELTDHGRAPGIREVARLLGMSTLDSVMPPNGELATLLIYDIPRSVQPTQLVGRIIEGNSVSSDGQVVWNLRK